MSNFSFSLIAHDQKARRGRVMTRRGSFETPAFMPVGTAATVKAMLPENVAATGAEIILGNTYHLMLRPGAGRIAALGGLHRFMNWPGPILTDSGGFQVMSLAELRTLDEEGVRFRSHIDGRPLHLTPESSIATQLELGSDILMAFDECTPFPAKKEAASHSMELSMRWAERSRRAFLDAPPQSDGTKHPALFGIQQGSTYPDLREKSAEALTQIGFEGYAIGGLAVGEGQEMMFEVLDYAADMLPQDKPRYLMGVGKPEDIVGAVQRGVDMMDCVLPSRSGRTAQAHTRFGSINLRNARHESDPRPLDEECTCPCCTSYSRAYLHHVVKAREIIASMLLTWHNLHYYQELMAALRGAIEAGRLDSFVGAFNAERKRGDLARVQ